MTKIEAKELSLEVWRYLAKHPEIEHKKYLPIELYERIEIMQAECPLCELFVENYCRCPKCPLKACLGDSLFHQWQMADNKEERKEAAQKIVEIIEAWNPEG